VLVTVFFIYTALLAVIFCLTSLVLMVEEGWRLGTYIDVIEMRIKGDLHVVEAVVHNNTPDVAENLDDPQVMYELTSYIVELNPLISGSAIAFGGIEDQYDALLQAWYAGQGGAKALAEVLFGDYNPGGKLPVTFYASNDDLPDFLDYRMENRTYRYFRGKALYPFGYGLSYTTFSIGKGQLSASTMNKDGKVTLTVPVTNTGKREGTETVQVYVKALDYPEAPIKSLKGFQKLSLKAGETATATITLDGEAFEYYDESIDELSTRPGRYQILYGNSSQEKDLKMIPLFVK
jgi:beta-glucosidase